MRYLIFFLSLCLATVAVGQSPLSNELSEDFQEDFIDPDSVDYESYTKKTSSFKALFNGKPGKAILSGMLFPGGGQIYNKDYWKVPIAWAAEGAAVYTFIYFRGEFNALDNAYRNAILGLDNDSYRGVTGVKSLGNFRQRFQKSSEQAGVAMIVVHILVAVESYIDRHLSSFDIDEDLTFENYAPGIGTGTTLNGVTLSYRF